VTRPDVKRVLDRLKPFQRRTVHHAFDRLFTAKDSTARFLVADEVGLGKTLIARGIIARAIDHLWSEVGRIDIIYICSNASIARSNLPKLQIEGALNHSFALATRLTMLATDLVGVGGKGLKDNKLNFVSFTPGTSFRLGHSGGQARERMVLFRLLEPLVDRRLRTGLMNFLQHNVRDREAWRWRLGNEHIPVEASIQFEFEKSYRQSQLESEIQDTIDEWFRRSRTSWPWEARYRRNTLLGQLRQLLAEKCVQALQPDLVILDEFQRFKTLLDADDSDAGAQLARSLFNAMTPEGAPVRTLLLSATPYKLYTTDAEIDQEDHYKDFIATTRFLVKGNESRLSLLRGHITQFGTLLKTAANGAETEGLVRAKKNLEDALGRLMARTERITASASRDAMVKDEVVHGTITPKDVHQYLGTDALFRVVGDRDPLKLWKSAPYLAHFMHGYKFNERLVEKLNDSPSEVVNVVKEHPEAFLCRRDLEKWQRLDPANAKLRDVASDLLDGGLWKLLWIPPTVPYWPLAGPFKGMEMVTKTLLFSAWNVVPDVVTGVLSYEAERRMIACGAKAYGDQPDQLLKLDDAGSRHRLLLLLLPCLPLANIHPLEAFAVGKRPRTWVRARVEELLRKHPDPSEGRVDKRWEWAAPLVLDPGLRSFLIKWREDSELPRPQADRFNSYLGDLIELDPTTLGKRPTGLANLITDLAMGSPAILATRMVGASGVSEDVQRRVAVQVADAFWHLFNRPAVVSLLTKNLYANARKNSGERRYWRLVLRYCREGNLQAVLDEHWHLLWEQNAWGADADLDSVARTCAGNLAESIVPMPSRVHVRFFDRLLKGEVSENDVLRVRTIFALRFGNTHSEQDAQSAEKRVTADAVRMAFNSPFRPFVLASTSVGQEGLDFHPWCHRITHWDLPGNPVDMEQREGRVHRYKGHAVRRNVAAAHDEEALATWEPKKDLWQILFDLADRAARGANESDLIPFWIAPGQHLVQRRVPLLPYTREVEVFERLKRQLAAYRVVFGQPRQEELLTLLGNTDVNKLGSWAIDMSPPEKDNWL